MSIGLLISSISSESIVLPLIGFLLNKNKIKVAYAPLLIYLVLTSTMETVAVVLAWLGKNNLWLYTPFSVIEYFLLLQILNSWQNSKLYFLKWTIWLISIVVVCDIAFISKLKSIPSFSKSVESLLFIWISLSSFYLIIKSDRFQRLNSNPSFWLSIAILTYNAGNLFFFAIEGIQEQELIIFQRNIWIAHSLLNCLFSVLVYHAIICLVRTSTSN